MTAGTRILKSILAPMKYTYHERRGKTAKYGISIERTEPFRGAWQAAAVDTTCPPLQTSQSGYDRASVALHTPHPLPRALNPCASITNFWCYLGVSDRDNSGRMESERVRRRQIRQLTFTARNKGI